MTGRVIRAGAWGILAAVSLEVAARQLLRTSWLPGAPDAPLALAALAAAAGLVAAATRPARIRGLVFGVALAAGLALQLHNGARLQSDAFYYYAYLRSAAFDRDVSLANDYRMLGLGDKPHLFEPTVTGYAHSAWTVGPAIVWAPFFGAGHVAATRLQAAGRDVATDGTSFPYRQSIVIAGLVYALIGWWAVLRLCESWFPTRVAASAVLLLATGSFMLWYTLIEPTMTHAPSMAAVSLFLLWWRHTRDARTPAQWIALGVLAGLMTLIRWQNALFALVPAVEALTVLVAAARAGDHRRVTEVLVGGLSFTAVAACVFSPQMVAWKAIYGAWLAVSPVGPQIRLASPELELTLFSSRNGLVAMTPLLYVALTGLAAFAWRHRRDGVPMVLAVAAMVWFNASIQDWWGSDGFGGRRFDGIMPAAAIGLATALTALQRWIRAYPQWTVAVVLAAGVGWNVTLVTAAQRGLVRLGEAIDFGRVGGAQARLGLEWIGHPFSFPANYWFAWRNGVSPAAYDRLGPSMFLGDPRQPTGRIDVGGDDALLLGAGWFGTERDGDTTFRWATHQSGVIIPLARVAPLTVELRARAFGFPGAPPQRVTIDTGRGRFGPFELGGEWQTITVDTPASAWRAGLNRVQLSFDRAHTPASVGLGGDARPLAAAVDVFRVTAR